MDDMGVLHVGTTVTGKLLLDNSASDEADLLLAYGRVDGTSNSDSRKVAPGGAGTVKQALDMRGRVEILVNMAAQADSGTLIVSENGKEKDRKAIVGDVIWVYTVVAAPVPTP